jgi:hypothetical protein
VPATSSLLGRGRAVSIVPMQSTEMTASNKPIAAQRRACGNDSSTIASVLEPQHYEPCNFEYTSSGMVGKQIKAMLLAALAGLSIACAFKNESASYVPIDSCKLHPVIDASSPAARLAAAECGFTWRCDAFTVAIRANTQSDCICASTYAWQRYFEFLRPAIDAKRIAEDEALVSKCVAYLDYVPCDFTSNLSHLPFVMRDAGECERIVSGLQETGGQCSLDEECPRSDFCGTEERGARCGTCRNRAGPGESCANPCAEDLACSYDGGQVCLPKATTGESCRLAGSAMQAGGACVGKLSCVKDSASAVATCEPRPKLGEQCQPFPNDLCDQGSALYCQEGKCAKIHFSPPGGWCLQAPAIGGLCNDYGFCRGDRCVAAPPAGSPCAPDPTMPSSYWYCAFGAYCDRSAVRDSSDPGICRPQKAAGDICTAGFDCAWPAGCENLQNGQGTCRVPEWRQCG